MIGNLLGRSIRRKLIVISMLSVVCALAAAGTVFIVSSQRSLRDVVVRDVTSTALVIADNSTAALSFGDAGTAAEILQSLEATPHMDLACLYDAGGRLFATYSGLPLRLACPTAAPATDTIDDRVVAIRRPVVLSRRRIGSLFLQRNLDDVAAHQRAQVVLLVLIVIGASGLAFFLSSWLQQFVSEPVRALADAARAVSERKDYSVRATRQTEDELGLLVDAFNEMLTQVETRTGELQAIRAELETKVVELQHEVVERRRMEEERSELLRREREASRLKDEFLATISHELRTPLNAILGWSRMLASGVLDGASSQRALETIERNARSQAHLIEDLLDISRIMSGRMRLDVRPLDLQQVIEAALDAVRPAAEAKQIAVDRVLDPAAASAIGDPDRLQQVFWNLLSNAVKFTPEGQRIEVRLRRLDGRVEVSVVDSGQGIDAAFLPHVFDSFRQADSTSTRQHGGLGLGLAIVRHLVELHGGSVAASSRGPGQGATFTVRLPMFGVPEPRRSDVESSGSLPPVDDIAPPGVEGRPLDGVRVLVVEDELDTLLLLKTVLAHYGAEVRGAGTVRDALAALNGWRVDVVVSDIGLPGEDGYSFIERLRSRPASEGGAAPAIALTAYARSSDRARALAAGFQQHIAKPVEPGDLVAAIDLLAHGPRSAGTPGREKRERQMGTG